MAREQDGCWFMGPRVITRESFETVDCGGIVRIHYLPDQNHDAPNCCICDKGLATGDKCELVCFHKTPEQEAWYAEAESRLILDHPPNCEWFCEDHLEAARSLVELDLDQTLAKDSEELKPGIPATQSTKGHTMTVQDHQRVSYEVQKLHSKTLDPKLMRGGTVDAIGFARDAYKKASTLPETWSQWRQLTAYRLAHLLLRRQDSSLQEIDELLSIAEGADFLEPLRSFCHLAVLHRMRDGCGGPGERDVLNVRCEKAFDTAISHVKGQVNKNTRTANTAEGAKNSYTAQDSSFNTLELLSYALKLPYAPLEGISRDTDFSPYRDRSSASHAWQILSQGFESVWMTEEFARREFASRISDGPCIAVELAPDRSRNEKSKWAFQPNKVSDWISVPPNSDRLIETLLKNSAHSTTELQRKVVYTVSIDPGKRLRDVKSQTLKGVRQLASNAGLKVFEKRKGSDMYDLTEEIPFIVLKKY